jgi:hypothetical protein
LAAGDGGMRAIAGSVFIATMFFKGSSRRSAKNPFFWQRAGYGRQSRDSRHLPPSLRIRWPRDRGYL